MNEMLLIPLSRQGKNLASTSSHPLLEQHSSFPRLPDACSHDQENGNNLVLAPQMPEDFCKIPISPVACKLP